jgi:hypothetical protein
MAPSEGLRFAYVPELGVVLARPCARPIGGCSPAAEDNARFSSVFVSASGASTEGPVHRTTLRPVGPS